MMKTRAEHTGFTLVEVMVALVVIAVALPALLKALYQQVDGTGYLRDKSIAQWVATNKLTESRIQLSRDIPPRRGERTGTDSMAGQEWYWEVTTQETEVENFYRMEVRVGLQDSGEDSDPLYTLVGFMYAANLQGGN